ncbi:MAG: ImmA/IrrE family metallo-endopeptidase [Oscillospiraceae bacterium]|nr:ImmA/IrrE family metallo-endopeptidase [Oscillospiraceae bacterium]
MNAKADLYSFIERMRNQYLALYYVRDIKGFCDSNSISLYIKNFDSRGFCGAAFVGEKKDTIVLNGRRNTKEMMFDFVHEFIHTRKHRHEEKHEFTCFDKRQNSFLEWEANEGAAEFLVNYKLFIPIFCELYEFYANRVEAWQLVYGGVSLIQELAKRFSVTEMIILNRIKNLSYEIDQYSKGTSVDHIFLLSGNQQSIYNITPTNYIENIARIQVQYDFALPWDGMLSASY